MQALKFGCLQNSADYVYASYFATHKLASTTTYLYDERDDDRFSRFLFFATSRWLSRSLSFLYDDFFGSDPSRTRFDSWDMPDGVVVGRRPQFTKPEIASKNVYSQLHGFAR